MRSNEQPTCGQYCLYQTQARRIYYVHWLNQCHLNHSKAVSTLEVLERFSFQCFPFSLSSSNHDLHCVLPSALPPCLYNGFSRPDSRKRRQRRSIRHQQPPAQKTQHTSHLDQVSPGPGEADSATKCLDRCNEVHEPKVAGILRDFLQLDSKMSLKKAAESLLVLIFVQGLSTQCISVASKAA